MKKHCIPCTSKSPKLSPFKISELLEEVPEYTLVEVEGMPRIFKLYNFKNFKQALCFTNAIAHLAEEENHHPQIILEWAKVKVSWWTHAISGLDTNDFIMAVQSENTYKALLKTL